MEMKSIMKIVESVEIDDQVVISIEQSDGRTKLIGPFTSASAKAFIESKVEQGIWATDWTIVRLHRPEIVVFGPNQIKVPVTESDKRRQKASSIERKLLSMPPSGKWWDCGNTITLFHGTSSALIPRIKESGILRPIRNGGIKGFALEILSDILPRTEWNQKIEAAVYKAVKNRHITDDAPPEAIYMTIDPTMASDYADIYAERGGELYGRVASVVKDFTGEIPKPRFLGAKPVVLEVQIPKSWVFGSDGWSAFRNETIQDWCKKVEDSVSYDDPSDYLDFVGLLPEYFVMHDVPPEMIISSNIG